MIWTGKIIKQYRKEKKLTCRKMAIKLGLSVPTYYRMEQGKGIEKYESRLNEHYNAGYTLKQKKILTELGLEHLINEKK